MSKSINVLSLHAIMLTLNDWYKKAITRGKRDYVFTYNMSTGIYNFDEKVVSYCGWFQST